MKNFYYGLSDVHKLAFFAMVVLVLNIIIWVLRSVFRDAHNHEDTFLAAFQSHELHMMVSVLLMIISTCCWVFF